MSHLKRFTCFPYNDCWEKSENIHASAGYYVVTNVKVPSAGSEGYVRTEYFPHVTKLQYSRNHIVKATWGNSENIHTKRSAIIVDDVNGARMGNEWVGRNEYFNSVEVSNSLMTLTTLIEVIIIID
jgi:hypothetical protein